MGIWSKYMELCDKQQEENRRVLEERRKNRYKWGILGLGFLAIGAWKGRDKTITQIEVHES